MPKFGDPLFVVSPLTRTLQTFLISNPFPERLAQNKPGADVVLLTTGSSLGLEKV